MSGTSNNGSAGSDAGALPNRTLEKLASNLRTEFQQYSASKRPPENPAFEHDLNSPFAAQLVAARMGYRIFPYTWETPSEWILSPDFPQTTYKEISERWSGNNRLCSIAANLGASNIIAVQIYDVADYRGFDNLARLEDCFGKLPRSRILKNIFGFEIHMSGTINARHNSLGDGLTLKSLHKISVLPDTTSEISPRWLRVGDLQPAPAWLLHSSNCRS